MIRLQKLTEEYRFLLWTWRNANRKYFVFNKAIPLPDHLAWFDQYLQNPTDLMYIVTDDDEAIGSVGLTISNGNAWINRVMLGDKTRARHGAMSIALQDLMRQFGFQTYSLEVLKTNTMAIQFYEKNGFVISGKRDKCYIMKREG